MNRAYLLVLEMFRIKREFLIAPQLPGPDSAPGSYLALHHSLKLCSWGLSESLSSVFFQLRSPTDRTQLI